MRHRLASNLIALGLSLSLALPLSSWAKEKPGEAKPVTLAQVSSVELREQITLFGTSIPWKKVELSPRIDGLVTGGNIDEGGWLLQGDPVLRLESRLAEIDVEVARAKVAGAEAKQRDAGRKLDDLLRLKDARHVPESSIDTARANLEIARADLVRARAELAGVQEILDRHQLPAPFAGMVTAKHVERGQWIKRDEPAIELIELDTLRVRASVPQRHYPEVKTGDSATVSFDALPGRTFEGKIIARIAVGDQSSRTFPLLIDIDNQQHLLAPGMSARVVLALGQPGKQGLVVAQDAIVAKSDGTRLVWRVQADGDDLIAEPVTVQLGKPQGSQVEVISDRLAAGDRVVELGNETLKPGQRVADRSEAASLTAR